MRVFGGYMLGAVVLAGCSLTALDGFTGGASAGGPDGGDAMAPAETGTSSSSSTGGSVDAGDAGDAALPCVYCTNFENASLQDLATSLEIDDSGKLELDEGSLRARLPANANPRQLHVQLIRELSSTARRVTVETDLRVDDAAWAGATGNTIVLAVGINEVDGTKGLYSELYVGDAYTSVTTNNAGELIFDETKTDLKRDAWVRVRLETDFTPGAGAFRLFFDGRLVASRSGIPFTAIANAKTNLFLGLARSNAPTPALDVSYDNVAVTLP